MIKQISIKTKLGWISAFEQKDRITIKTFRPAFVTRKNAPKAL